MTATIVILDPDRDAARRVGFALEADGWRAHVEDGRRDPAEVLRAVCPSVVISALRLVDRDVFSVIDAARALDPELAVLIATPLGKIDLAIDAVLHGGWQYVITPVRLDELRLQVARARDHRGLRLRAGRLMALRELEAEHIAFVLAHCQGNKTRAAEILGIDPSTLHRRLRSRPAGTADLPRPSRTARGPTGSRAAGST